MSHPPPDLETLLHPPRKPYRHGFLPVGDGHRVYFEESGRPDGLPVVCLHGGPGSGSSTLVPRLFDPARFRVIQIDQRGAGRSEPRGRLDGNDTAALVGDLETLRRHLGIPRWLVFGGSWGATLGLAYAQAHPTRVLGLVLRGPLLGRRRDCEWFFGPDGVARVYPQDYRAFLSVLPERHRADPLTGYQTLFRSSDPDERARAARAWAAWDRRVATGQLADDAQAADPTRYAIACHYAVHGFFLPDDGVLGGMPALADVPGTVVQGQWDLVCPAEGAATLVAHWPRTTLHMVEHAGHLVTEPGILRALLAIHRRLAGHRPRKATVAGAGRHAAGPS